MKQSIDSLSRRSFAFLCGSAGVVVALGASLSEKSDSEPFAKLSAALTGFPASALDAQFAQGLAVALAAGDRADDLERRLRAPDRELADLETDIIAAWYSGVLPTPSGPRVGAFSEALIWAALGFTTPPGVCGAPGGWARPPRVVA